jgi:hypothetical protein
MVDTDPVGRLLELLPDVRPAGDGRWMARCPAHEDRHASLGLTRGDDGRALLNCHAGCQVRDVVAAVGLTLADLFAKPESGTNGHHNGHGSNNGNGRRIAKLYDYVGAEGELLYQKVRYDPKDFRQRRPDGNGGWTYNLGDVQRVLYRQPELNDADPDEWVHLVEGEKAVEALADVGLVATCTCDGAGKWKPVYTEALRARRVAVLVDNDDPGRAHGRLVAEQLVGTATEVRVVELPGLPVKGDVFDYLQAGRTAGDLSAAIDATPAYVAAVGAEERPTEDEPDATTANGDGPAATPSPNRHTDVANARRLVEAFDGTARWNHTRGSWLVYGAAAGLWAEDTAGRVEQTAKGVADAMWAAIGGLYPSARKAAVRHATRSSSAGGIGAMQALSRSEPGVTVTADQFDVDPWVLNCRNGVVQLRTGERNTSADCNGVRRL